jgi:hypothetical protein
MSAHEHGKMKIAEQEKTFHGFIKAGIWLVYACIAIALFLAVFGA